MEQNQGGQLCVFDNDEFIRLVVFQKIIFKDSFNKIRKHFFPFIYQTAVIYDSFLVLSRTMVMINSFKKYLINFIINDSFLPFVDLLADL